MTDAASSFHPPWAVVCWCDDRFIYAEIACKEGPPFIFKEALTNDGLNKLLHLMRDARRKAPPQITGDYNSAINATVRLARGQTKATEVEREKAREVLKKLGMLDRVVRRPSKS